MENSVNLQSPCLPIPSAGGDFRIHCDENCLYREESIAEEWEEELEQFWIDPRHKLQELDSQLSSSLERHLLFDDCIQQPYEQEEKPLQVKESAKNVLTDSVIHGEDINDIPTHYTINGFKPNEFIVIGTYIDKRIIPGFKYSVRRNQTDKFLFNGEAVRLEQIGLGYGKRLTFQSSSLNNNTHYFWSDGSPAGFGFSLCVVDKGDAFGIYSSVHKQYCGRIIVTQKKGQQVVKSITIGDNGRVEALVEVEFSCDVVYVDCANKQTLVVQDTVASGTATVVKKNPLALPQVELVELENFVVEDCQLKCDN